MYTIYTMRWYIYAANLIMYCHLKPYMYINYVIFGVKKVQPSKVELHLEVNVQTDW